MPPRRPRAARDDSDEEGGHGALSQQDLNNAANQLVRFALFHEYRRAPLRRDAAAKLVIPHATRRFPEVLEHAQRYLRLNLGLELYELRQRGRAGPETQTQTQAPAESSRTATQRRKGKRRADAEDDDSAPESGGEDGAANGPARSERKAPGTRTYILRSVLAPGLVKAMAHPNPLPYFEADRGDADMVRDHEADSGALLRWDKADATGSGHVALVGIRAVILCLILASGRVIDERTLYAYLRRLNLERHTVLPWKSTDSYAAELTLEGFIDLLVKQSYLEKTKTRNAGGDGPAEEVQLRWGAREAEFSETAAASFIEKIFIANEEDEEEEEQEEEEQQPRRGRSRRDADEGEDERRGADRGERLEAKRLAKRFKLRKDLQLAAGQHEPLRGDDWEGV